MIDGAHVLTPGVLRFGLAGLRRTSPRSSPPSSGTSARVNRATPSTSATTPAYEDRLFDTIDWPHDGYRLFDIGHFIGDRDWLDGVWESNCIFAPRSLLEQVGGYDESFSMPGGGLRQPRALRAAGLVAGRHRRHHPRRGLVPPGPRRHHHEPARCRRAARPGLRLRAPVRRAARPALPPPGQADPLRGRHPVAVGAPHQGAPAHRPGVRRGRARRR